MPSHHAVLYCGTRLTLLPINIASIEAVAEIEYCTTSLLTIAQVRSLIQSAYSRPFEKAYKTIVIEAGQIANEAQHALLKVLEEPPLTTKFIFVLPSFAGLLPTLLSRLHQPAISSTVAEISPHYVEFLMSSYSARMTIITQLTKIKDTVQLDELSSGLSLWLEQQPPTALAAKLLNYVTLVSQRGAAKKMIWEEIALLLPVK